MKAIQYDPPGTIRDLKIGVTATPQVTPGEVLMKVHATALNRADLLQRKGMYPPPPGVSEILGLEVSGEIYNPGNSSKFQEGDRVFALLPGGGYAQYAAVPEDMLMPVPKGMNYESAAAIAEAFLTAWQALSWHTRLEEGEKVLIHAGASGVGSAAIQLAKQMGAEVFVTASRGKHLLCDSLGADHCIDYKSEDFEEVIKSKGGVNVVLDFIGGPYMSKNLQVLNADGRFAVIGLLGGGHVKEMDMSPILRKRISIIGSTLRARPVDYKVKLTQDFHRFAGPLFDSEKLSPVIDSVYDWHDVQDAHERMEKNLNQGKIVMWVSHE